MKNKYAGVSTREISEAIEKTEANVSPGSYRSLFSFIDLTSLNNTDSENSIKGMADKVNNFSSVFPDLPSVAAICVFPRFVPVARERLVSDKINIASVVGSFPDSQTFIENKIDEARRVVNKGADELDMVISLGEFLEGNYDLVASEISSLKETVGGAHLKVILETGVIEKPELIYKASMLAMEAGADFIKTSTGKAAVSATPEAAYVMCNAIYDHYKVTKRIVGFKPAGGIGTAGEALKYYSIVESVLGKEWLVPDRFRIGASRLANDLLTHIKGSAITYF